MHFDYTHHYQIVLMERTSPNKLKEWQEKAFKRQPTEIPILNEYDIDSRGLACTNPDCNYDTAVPAVIARKGLTDSQYRLSCRSCIGRPDTNAPTIDMKKSNQDYIEEITTFLLAVEKLIFATNKTFTKELYYLRFGVDPQDYLKSIKDDMQSLHPSNYITKREEGY